MVSTIKFALLFAMFCLLSSSGFVLGVVYQVGGKGGWVVPSRDARLYNEWASKNRFLVNDTLDFKYQKDSVLAVTNEEYEKCKSWHPILFSNNGDTVFKLDRPGFFYFISGVSGHCNKGLKMVIKVRESHENVTSAPPPKKGGAVQIGGAVSSITLAVVTSVSLFGGLLA